MQQGRKRLRIGYVPGKKLSRMCLDDISSNMLMQWIEHFSTPLAFAQQHFDLDHELIPEPLGTGALSSRLKAHTEEKQLDVAIGLTEGFVSDLGKTKAAGYEAGYGLVGTYVESPLCWAISTGAQRPEINGINDLKGKRVGVSRLGRYVPPDPKGRQELTWARNSGSYVMSFVLADQQGWLDDSGKEPFGVIPAGDFAALRDSVNLKPPEEKNSEFFMWEHFTTKKYWDNGELKRIGEIYTPWASWMIAARNSTSEQIPEILAKINQGVKYYKEHAEETIKHITGTMHYSEEDAREWMKTVKFPDDVNGVKADTVNNTVSVLQKAGVLKSDAGGAEHMVTIQRY